MPIPPSIPKNHKTSRHAWLVCGAAARRSVTSVPVANWVLLGDQGGLHSRTEGVDLTVVGAPHGYPIPDQMLIAYRVKDY
jgi:hypothetical protein